MPTSWPLVVVIGLAAGYLSGQFGIGGGLVTTPAIRLLLGRPEMIAVGTPLPVIIPTALVGAFAYARRGLIDVRAGLVIGAFGGVFSVLGARLTTLVGGSTVMVVTAGVICWMAVDMTVLALRGERPEAEREARAVRAHSVLWLGVLGAVTGLYSGFLGLGGGFIVVPALVRHFAFPAKRAMGTSLVVVSLLAVPGTVAHYMLGNIDPGLAATLAVGVVPGALLGAKVTAIAREKTVKIGFAALLLVTGVVLALTEIGALS